ncbi:MAG: hypothetical protein OXB94_04295, partial [Nitrospira sp.]|nr:hypothetical protein [Nitrospira sp.]
FTIDKAKTLDSRLKMSRMTDGRRTRDPIAPFRGRLRARLRTDANSPFVIPAKAGIQGRSPSRTKEKAKTLDSRSGRE